MWRASSVCILGLALLALAGCVNLADYEAMRRGRETAEKIVKDLTHKADQLEAEYERLKETIDVLCDAALMRQIRRSRRFYAAGGKGLSVADVFGETIPPAKRRAR